MHRNVLAIAAACLLVISACGGSSPSVTPAGSASSAAPSAASPSAASPSAAAGGGSVSFTRFAEADMVFHPVEAQSNQYMLYYLVFDTLVTLDLSDTTLQTIKPRMAESWEISPDAMTFTFHLRKDIKWHDGTPFTAKDVVYTATWAAENQQRVRRLPAGVVRR